MRLHTSFALLALVLVGVPTAASAVQIHEFKGSRDQVRAACTGSDRELIESSDTSFCIDKKKGTGVVCGDDGTCTGSTPRASTGEGPRNQVTGGRLGSFLK